MIRVRQSPLGIALLWIASGLASSQSQQILATELRVPPRPTAYAGDEVCAQCHEEEAKSYFKTRHYRDSSLPSRSTILGHFRAGRNVLRTSNPDLVFAMVAGPDGFFEGAMDISDPHKPKGEAARIGVVFGSGRNGQTYLYWNGDQLFEMPVSYWTATDQWINSPGYPDGKVVFNLPILPRCLECHSRRFQTAGPPANRYVKDSLVLGIGCEKCHGPGAEHVARERSAAPPAAGSAEIAIVNPARLSRERQMDVCGLCHAGAGTPIRPSLSFRPGDDLARYVAIKAAPDGQAADVHGEQVEALERSKCFNSGQLTCTTCHNVHKSQENADAYSVDCLDCHTVHACPKSRTLGENIQTRCVACHMPIAASTALISETAGNVIRAEMRQHRIGIYPGN